jgi:hypothetical protein
MRAISSTDGPSSPGKGGNSPGGGGGGKGGSPSGKSKAPPSQAPGAGADIDAVLQALLKRTKLASLEEKAAKEDKSFGSRKALPAPKPLVPIREGDGGVGVDLSRVWDKYDRDKSGFVDAQSMRGLLTDLGVYVETTALVSGAANPGGILSAASVEGAASAGPGEWRFAAALASLDPKGTGHVAFQNFSDWWNSVDAAMEKALAIKSSSASVGSRSRPHSARNSAAGGGGHHGGGPASVVDADVVGSPGAIVESVTAAVVYVLECRRLLAREEVTAVGQMTTGDGFDGAATASSSGPAAAGAGGRRASMMGKTALNAPATAPGLPPIPASSLSTSFTPWTVLYVGEATRFRVPNLLPNGEYQYRVCALGRHAFSTPSPVLSVVMPPLAPFAPVIIKSGARTATLRWYPGELSADKFEVQVKLLETLLPQGATVHGNTTRLKAGASTAGKLYAGRNTSEATKRRLATSRALAATGDLTAGNSLSDEAEMWQEDPDGDGWVTLYTGTSTFATLTGLFANSINRVRVIAYNAAGVPSRPSVETQLITPDAAAQEPLTVANAGRYFVVECGAADAAGGGMDGTGRSLGPLAAQDIVVGDTILFTEDVFVDSGPDPDPYHPVARKEVHESHPRAQFLCSRTVAAVVLVDSASHLAAGSGASANVGTEGGPVYVGASAKAAAARNAAAAPVQSEETRAIMLGKGNAGITKGFKAGNALVRPRTASSSSSSHGGGSGSGGGIEAGAGHGPAQSIGEAVASRTLSLQVEWCTVSVARAGTYVLPPGAIVKRKQADVAHLDIFRCMWEDEAGRWSLGEELRASYDK